MPHIDVKFFPRELSDTQKQALADELTQVIVKHLQSKESSVSVALNEVQPAQWKGEVWDKEIAPFLDTLARKPGYEM
ncbi:tautomerase PptA [Cronobacter dublinensis]|uniref:tautomerase PptA n=1 Tax=Cronobacter dublinensis TaxID=413497 RepID=UPI000CFB5B2A|nr:tautomerase PptA [Cronobacter dublinensis]